MSKMIYVQTSIKISFFVLLTMLVLKPGFGQISTGGTIVINANQTIAYNSVPGMITANTALGLSCTDLDRSYQWESSTDNINYANISGATLPYYSPPALTITTYYRRKTFCSSFSMYTTNVAVVNIIPLVGVPHASHTIGDPNNDMNWIHTKTFDARGVAIQESKNFFDANGRSIQTQHKVKYRKDKSTVYTHVVANQPIRDAMGQDAASTLAAPIDNNNFLYIPGFVRYGSGSTSYDYRHFDRYNPSGTETDKTNTPDAVGNAVKGTLGWYYSNNNNWEPYTPATEYPYVRQAFYRDGVGNLKKSGGLGEAFKMGSGRESQSYVTPVVKELDHYLTVRDKYFSSIGENPATLKENAIQMVSRDANGREGVIIQDKDGRLLVAGRPGSELPVSNVVTLQMPYSYFLDGDGIGYHTSSIAIKGTNIKVYESLDNGLTSTLFFNGLASSFVAGDDEFSDYYRIESADPFTISYTAATSYTSGAYTYSRICDNCPAEQNGKSQYFFKLFAPSTVDITGSTSFDLYEMGNAEATISFTSGGTLAAGYYKLVNKSDVPLTLEYSNGYADLSYNFYNHLGQLIATIAPEGVKKLYGSGINDYAAKTDVPFISLSEYDVQGRLVQSSSTDGGIGKLVYRKDGKIRFSQNAEQQTTGRYSYTNYDALGRPVESGEYYPDGSGIAFNDDLTSGSNPMKDILENVSPGGGLTSGVKKDVITTLYDVPNADHGVSGYTQDPYYMRGAVSVTHKYSSVSGNPPYSGHTSATWYSYDEEGKVTWLIKYIDGLGYKTTDYTYSSLGQLVKRVYQGNPLSGETFVHYYEYDPENLQLWKVYTNTTDDPNPATRKLQASYTYYLHGPLKRVELADDLQGLDYTYTLQGALKSINNSNAAADPGGDGTSGSVFQPDAFGMVLDYYPDDYKNTRSGIADIQGLNTTAQVLTESYAGNIKAMSWFSKKPASMPAGSDQPNAYIYNYDDKYQFTESTWGNGLTFSTGNPTTLTTNNHFKETVKHPTSGPGYDANGNILYLQRTDGSGTPTDKFTYNYETNKNRLASVVHDDNSGTPQTYATYEYDDLGQLTGETNTFGGTDKSKYIKYDVTGKVIAVCRDPDPLHKVVEYVYDEMGQRIIKRNYNSSYQLIENTYYLGGVIYTQPVSTGIITVQEYEIDGGAGRIGVFYPQYDVAGIYAYQLTDHLGNVRAVVAKSGSSLEVRMYTDYYPFGMTIPRLGGTNDYRYEYQGQYAEKDKATDWNAFELRMYDSRIARWLSVDPYGQYNSPYVGMGNDPVNGIDPDGGFWQELKNWIGGNGWISNAGLSMRNDLSNKGIESKYEWHGNRLTGYGSLTWADTEFGWSNFGDDYYALREQPVIHSQKFQAIADYFFKIGSSTYAIYPDLGVKGSFGLRFAKDANGLAFDINVASWEIFNYSFAEGSRSIFDSRSPDDVRVSHGVSASIGALGAGIGVEYNIGFTDVQSTIKATFGLDLSVVYNHILKESTLIMGKGFSAASGFGIDAEVSLKTVSVPNGDIQQWINKHR